MIILLSRVTKYGVQNFVRNGLLSSATIAVMTLTLILCTSLLVFGAAGRSTIQVLQEKIDISIYFKTTTDDNQILAVKKSLEALNEVKSVEFVSREDALTSFREKHKNDPTVIQSLDELGVNPLSASLNIKAKDPKNYAGIASFLETEVPNDIVDKVNYSQNQLVIDRLTKIVNTLRNGGLILAIILAAVAFLVAFNTIRLAIYSNRESVEIMRLVGASNSLIRGPYIVEGVIHGLIAAIITMIIFIPLVQVLGPYLKVLVPEFSITSYFWHNFLPLLGIQCLIGILLGIFSSFIAIRKYLKV